MKQLTNETQNTPYLHRSMDTSNYRTTKLYARTRDTLKKAKHQQQQYTNSLSLSPKKILYMPPPRGGMGGV